jgi:xylose isomerase
MYEPKPEHKFTFGLWSVGNVGGDLFGEPVRAPLAPVELVHLLAEVDAYGVNFHDNDLVPIDAAPAERDKIVADFKTALTETGLVVPTAAISASCACPEQSRRVRDGSRQFGVRVWFRG